MKQKDAEAKFLAEHGIAMIYICKDHHYATYLKECAYIGKHTPLLSSSMNDAMTMVMKSKELKVDLKDGNGEVYISTLSFAEVVEHFKEICLYDSDDNTIHNYNTLGISPSMASSIATAFGFGSSVNFDDFTFFWRISDFDIIKDNKKQITLASGAIINLDTIIRNNKKYNTMHIWWDRWINNLDINDDFVLTLSKR